MTCLPLENLSVHYSIPYANRCDDFYSLKIFVDSIPREINKWSIREDKKYGCLNVKDGDVIAYATQASQAVYLIIHDGKRVREVEAEVLRDNYNHTGNNMYICMDKSSKLSNFYDEIEAQFEVKHSFFDSLHKVLEKLPDEIVRIILPRSEHFTGQVRADDLLNLRHIPKEYENILHLNNMEPDQLVAYQVALSCQSGAPPVLISGAFGTGKTCFLSSVAYCFISEAERNGDLARVLICAHHQATPDTILQAYFGPMLKHKSLPLNIKVVRITPPKYRFFNEEYRPCYLNINEFRGQAHHYSRIARLVVITTFLTSLHLKDMLPPGFFTHILIDEGAQTREPEAVAPLCLADRNTKIIIAGDARQVSSCIACACNLRETHQRPVVTVQ